MSKKVPAKSADWNEYCCRNRHRLQLWLISFSYLGHYFTTERISFQGHQYCG